MSDAGTRRTLPGMSTHYRLAVVPGDTKIPKGGEVDVILLLSDGTVSIDV